MQTAVAVICKTPHPNWLKFLSGFKTYDTYLIIDDNEVAGLDLFESEFPDVRLIQLNEKTCENAGFTHMNSAHFKKVSGWDKALYYFAINNTSYQQVWLFEDDVFFHNENTIINIDSDFPAYDLLTAPYKISTSTSKDWWWWPTINIPFEQPYYNAMVCGLRISARFLEKIKMYAEEYRRLFFLEAFFPTLAIKSGLTYNTPKQLRKIYFRHNWHYLNKKYIFHPIKNIASHTEIRITLNHSNIVYGLKFFVTDFFIGMTIAIKEQIKLMSPKYLRRKAVYKMPDSSLASTWNAMPGLLINKVAMIKDNWQQFIDERRNKSR